MTKTPKGRDIHDGDHFAFNANFSCPMSRIKILTVTNKVESGEEAKETQDRVEEDRRLMTEVRRALQAPGSSAGCILTL